MNVFRDFELKALELLLHNALTPEQLRNVETFSGTVSYKYTGSGYFLTISDRSLPMEKSTCHVPAVVGNSGDVQCGFIAFLGNHELTLECHTWGPVDVPDDFRDRIIIISTPTIPVIEPPSVRQ
jgi:hypothetical protein